MRLWLILAVVLVVIGAGVSIAEEEQMSATWTTGTLTIAGSLGGDPRTAYQTGYRFDFAGWLLGENFNPDHWPKEGSEIQFRWFDNRAEDYDDWLSSSLRVTDGDEVVLEITQDGEIRLRGRVIGKDAELAHLVSSVATFGKRLDRNCFSGRMEEATK